MHALPTHRQKLLFISPGLLITVVSFAVGICWEEIPDLHSQFLFYGILLLLTLLFVVYKVKPLLYKTVSYSLLGLLFCLLGLLQAKTHLVPPADPGNIYNLIHEKKTAGLEGILLKCPSVINTSSGPETRLFMKVKALYQPAILGPQLQQKTIASGQVLLTLKGLLPEELKPGNRFLVKANLSRVSTYSTPGAFNYKKHLANQSVHIKGWIQSPSDVLKVRTVTSSDPASALRAVRYIPERIRYRITDFLDSTLSQPARGLYKAILIGERNDVPLAALENFTGAGCIHILAISGMHMGLLALVAVGLLTWILKRSNWLLLHVPVSKTAVLIALLPLFIYALIAGFNIPVVRALLMTVVFILAILFDRPGNLINHILVAGLLILVWKPGAIFTASFQLSFSAVTAIAIIYPLIHRFLLKEPPTASPLAARSDPRTKTSSSSIIHRTSITFLKWLLAGVALTTAAMLGTFPLLVFHFNRLSLVAPFSNLLVEPLICVWSLFIGLLASICIPLFPPLAKILFIAGSYGLILSERICAFFTLLPHAPLWLPTPSHGEIMLAYLFLLSFFAALHLAGKQRHYSLIIALLFLCSLLAAPAVSKISKQPFASASVTFLDVGHGSSMLLRLQGNKNILIDGGGPESERFNIGERVIGPFLWKQKLVRLDTVVITHPHADHYNGLPFILSRFRPRELWINSLHGYDRGYRELLDLAGQLGIDIRVAQAGSILFESGAASLRCLHSGTEQVYGTDEPRQAGWSDPNDASLVLRFEFNNKSLLFPADISARMAEILIREGKEMKADVMMAPHHGSSSSMSRDFIGSVAPEYIVISAGRNNRFNLPAKSFYDLEKKGIKILSTGRDGTITFTMEKGEILVSRYQVN